MSDEIQPVHPLVSHCQHSLYDIYIGLPYPTAPIPHVENIWHTNLNAAKYAEWLLHDDQRVFVTKAKRDLKGMTLGCWCKKNRPGVEDEECHGIILALVANESEEETEERRKAAKTG